MPTLAAAAGLMLAHLFAGKLRFLQGVPRSRWLSSAGGISVAYVFLHLLPELAEGQRVLQAATPEGLRFVEHHAYLVAFAGLVIFYGLERAARGSREQQRARGEGDTTSSSVFWLHIASFSFYNLVIGYLLVRDVSALRGLLFFFVAMALHFIVTDFGLREHHKDAYSRRGRWLLSLAVLAGWALGVMVEIPEVAVSVLAAFLAGGAILNVLKEELPEERQSRFSAFLLGGAGYAALLLAL